MKSRDFALLLRTFGDVLESADAQRAREQIEALATLFDASPTSTVAILVKRLRILAPPPSSGRPSADDAARLLGALRKLFAVTAKASVTADVEAVETLLRDYGSTELSAFVRLGSQASSGAQKGRSKAAASVREDLVTEHLGKLEANLGDQDRFSAAFDSLRSDAGMGKSELAALAKRFTGTAVPSRSVALKKIWNRHQALVVSQAKARATSGRTAA